MARELCLQGRPLLIWGLFVCNLIIWASYMAIPIVIRSIHRQVGHQMPMPEISILFKTFIAACGWSHFAAAGVIFFGGYRFELGALIVTATVSPIALAVLFSRRRALVSGFRSYLAFRARVLSLQLPPTP